MQITATIYPLFIDYRYANKTYKTAFDSQTETNYPFETTRVEIGETFELPADAEFIRVRQILPQKNVNTVDGNDAGYGGGEGSGNNSGNSGNDADPGGTGNN